MRRRWPLLVRERAAALALRWAICTAASVLRVTPYKQWVRFVNVGPDRETHYLGVRDPASEWYLLEMIRGARRKLRRLGVKWRRT